MSKNKKDGESVKKIYSNDHITLSGKSVDEMQEEVEKTFEKLLFTNFPFDKNDPNLNETPKRLAKMYVRDIFGGCWEPEPKITFFPTDDNTERGIVVCGPMELKSMCSHHFMPIHGSAYIGYVPGEKIVGLSKLKRVVDYFARRPQIQELLTKQILDYFVTRVQPVMATVIISANHMCMSHRGVEDPTSSMYTRKTYFCPNPMKYGFVKDDLHAFEKEALEFADYGRNK